MTISAVDRDAHSQALERALELYRDLTVALRNRVSHADARAGDARWGTAGDAARDHRRALQTVLDIEVGLGKRSTAGEGAGGELDLEAARAEIAARLALRADP